MTYNPNIPDAAQFIDETTSQIETNFAQANTIMGIDHVEFDNATVANRGKHKAIRLLEQGGDPGTVADEMALYVKAVGGTSQLFIQGEGSTPIRQITNLSITSPGNTGTAAGTLNYIDTPFGIRMLWGLTNSFSPSGTVIMPAGTSTILSYTALANNASNAVTGGLVTLGPPDFITFFVPANISIRWTVWAVIA